MATINAPVIFVIGGPGSGKGTQCQKIVKKYGLTHLSVGDILRDECNSGSNKGLMFTELMRSGQLVPNKEVIALLSAKMKKTTNPTGFLIDGYPREIEQVKLFEEQVCRCSLVLFLFVPDDVMTARLLERAKTSGRDDDNEETIAKRLVTFHEYTQPILEYYGDEVKTIEAVGNPDEIFEQIDDAISSSVCFVK